MLYKLNETKGKLFAPGTVPLVEMEVLSLESVNLVKNLYRILLSVHGLDSDTW